MASRVVLLLRIVEFIALMATAYHYLPTLCLIVSEENDCLSHCKHFSLKNCFVLIQVESFVVVKTSLVESDFNHYTCTNMFN